MLRVHRSERADLLADLLAGVLDEPLGDPMIPEVVAVPTRGVERWLTQRLSHQLGCSPGREDGVAANIGFPFPGTLVGASIARAVGIEPEEDPWAPDRSVWPLIEVADTHMDDPELSPLREHLAAASPPRDDGALARFSALRHLADLYDRYAVHRPEMVTGWAAGDPGSLATLGRHSWQAWLWRQLRGAIGTPSPAERLLLAAARISAQPDLVDLPGRISLFGLTRLPASYLTVLQSIATTRDVHLFLLHPSGGLWDAVTAEASWVSGTLRRPEDPTPQLARNPLLRSWGRDAREMQLVLTARGAVEGLYKPVGGPSPTTLLGHIQKGVRENRPLPPVSVPRTDDARPVLDRSDTSLRLHSCHGRFRQVEVLREAILHLLEEDETLEPRDVIVMCPDVETYAPLIEAVFASGHSDEGELSEPQLRVRLADRSLRQTNPLLGAAAEILEIAGGRVTASDVLDFASREPVRMRFRFDDDEIARLETWVTEMGARWGLDASHRGAWNLERVPENTWEFGLDRLLLGVAMSEDGNRLFGSTLPLDDVSGASVDLAGRFAEFVARLADAVRRLSGRLSLREWCTRLCCSTEAMAAADPSESWQEDQLRRVLDDAAVEGTGGGQPLTLQEVRALLDQRLRGRPTRANFRTGDLTVCTLVPMRSVPHRVICLLGLDDGEFPRHAERDGDDVMASDPHVGDRDARSEDRQLVLDALLAATDHLVITYCGKDERTNRPRPPAVPVAELLDAVDRTVRAPEGMNRPRDAIVVEHPLQPFDPRNFEAGGLVDDRPWSFGKPDLLAARASTRPPQPRPDFIDAPLPDLRQGVVNLDAIVRFFKHPVNAFLRERLAIYIGGDDDEPKDALPIDLTGLDQWSVGDRMLRACMTGTSLQDAVRTERARGLLPPGRLAEEALDDIVPNIGDLTAAAESLVPGCTAQDQAGESIEVHLEMPDGRLILGTVPGVWNRTVTSAVYSRLAPKHRIEAWIRTVALAACRPDMHATAITVARSPASRGQPVVASLIDLAATDLQSRREAATERLWRLLDIYDRGMREPLPIYCATSAAWAEASRKGGDPAGEAVKKWNGGNYEGESVEEGHVLVLGGRLSFDDVLAFAPAVGEIGAGWDERETSRFGRLARRLWEPLLDCERLVFP